MVAFCFASLSASRWRVFYLLIRGGPIIPNGSTEPQINPYGAAGLAALVGMFARQATDKLAEIFESLFRSDKERARSEPLTPSGAPDLRGLDPANVKAGSANVVVRLVGDRFADDVAVTINQTGVKPLTAARNEVRVAVPDPMRSSPGTLTVQAINPGRSGGVSQQLPLVVSG